MAEEIEPTPIRKTLELQCRKVQDREPLKTLANGLMIVRCKKHEPIDLANLSRKQVVLRTSKVFGSKFASDWNLVNYVEWIESRLEELGWTTATGPATDIQHFVSPIGIARGNAVHTIMLRSDGRFVHAYPDEDAYE